MKRRRSKLQVFTVVEVWRGMAVRVRNFRRSLDAERFFRRLQHRHNLMEDDVQIFRTSL